MTATLGLTDRPDEAPPPFLMSIDVIGARITVRGELDRAHVHRLDEAVGVLAHTPSPRWSVDASAITFCDAEGLRALAKAQRQARAAHRTFVVERACPCLRRMLRLVGVDAEDAPAA